MDRIELGTFIIAGAMSDSDLELTGGNITLLENFVDKLHEVGIEVSQSEGNIRVRRMNSASIKCTNVLTEPFQGFPLISKHK